MTGKKSQSSPVGSPLSGNGSDSSSKEQDRFLPIANVSRIMKKSLPANAKISKEGKETVQECVSEFISFITGEASDKCQREKRKTVNGDDLLWAMKTLGFENYVSPLKLYLNSIENNEGDKTTSMIKEEDNQHHHHHQQQQQQLQLQLQLRNANSTTHDLFKGTTTHDLSISTRPNFHATVNGYYELDAKMGSRAMGYGENLMSGDYNLAKIHEINGTSNRVIATNLHHGVGW